MTDYYGNNDRRDYLAHYGVKGMRWKNHQYKSFVNGQYFYGNEGIGRPTSSSSVGGAYSRPRASATSAAGHTRGNLRRLKSAKKLDRNLARSITAQTKEIADMMKTRDAVNRAKRNRNADKEAIERTKTEQRNRKNSADIDKLAKEVIRGNWGAGADRMKKLKKAGHDYATVQNRVNELMGSSKRVDSKGRVVKGGSPSSARTSTARANTRNARSNNTTRNTGNNQSQPRTSGNGIVKNTMGKVRSQARNTYQKAKSSNTSTKPAVTPTTRLSKLKNTVSRGAKAVSNTIKRVGKTVVSGAKKVISSGRSFVSNLLKRKTSSTVNRPHSRKTTVSSGTATVRRGTRVGGSQIIRR